MRMIGSCKTDDATRTPFRTLGDGGVADYYIQSDEVADYYIQSDEALELVQLPAKMRSATQNCAPCKRQPRRAGKSVGLDSFPEAIRKKFESYAADICPEATFRTAEILNSEHEGSRIFSTYCVINGGQWPSPTTRARWRRRGVGY